MKGHLSKGSIGTKAGVQSGDLVDTMSPHGPFAFSVTMPKIQITLTEKFELSAG